MIEFIDDTPRASKTKNHDFKDKVGQTYLPLLLDMLDREEKHLRILEKHNDILNAYWVEVLIVQSERLVEELQYNINEYKQYMSK